MHHLKFLEQFDAGLEPGSRMPAAQDLPGYDAGFEAGIAAAKADQANLSQALVDKLVEIRFAHAEAQQQIMTSLQPLFHAISDQVLPGVLDDIRHAAVVEAMNIAAQNDAATPLRLSVHPSAEIAIARVTEALPDLTLTLHTDASLDPDDILISTTHRETQLDVAGLITNIQAALKFIAHPENEVVANG